MRVHNNTIIHDKFIGIDNKDINDHIKNNS